MVTDACTPANAIAATDSNGKSALSLISTVFSPSGILIPTITWRSVIMIIWLLSPEWLSVFAWFSLFPIPPFSSSQFFSYFLFSCISQYCLILLFFLIFFSFLFPFLHIPFFPSSLSVFLSSIFHFFYCFLIFSLSADCSLVFFFLVACTRLFKSPCRSVRPSVCHILLYFAFFEHFNGEKDGRTDRHGDLKSCVPCFALFLFFQLSWNEDEDADRTVHGNGADKGVEESCPERFWWKLEEQ